MCFHLRLTAATKDQTCFILEYRSLSQSGGLMNKANQFPSAGGSLCSKLLFMINSMCASVDMCCLTLLVGCEEDAEAALAAGLVRPHADDAQRGDQHDVVGHRGAELTLQVFNRTETRQEEIRAHRLLSSSVVICCAFQ